MSSVVYLGHVISEDGISTDPEKTSAVTKWPAPKNIKELRQFLGFAGFYRRYVEHYAQIVEPLNDLLKGHDTTGRASKRKKRSKKSNKPAVLSWADTQDPLFCTQAHQVMVLVLSCTKIRMVQKRSLHMLVVD